MSEFKALDLVKPLTPYVPEVIAPLRPVPFKQRAMWTGVTLLVFLVMSEIPLYGIVSLDSLDPLYWLRMMLASNRGTLMELGISPIVTSSMIVQLLQGAKLISVKMEDKNERQALQTAQKLFAIMISFGQATVYVLTGMYGLPSELGWGVCILLVSQLVFASFLVILYDELLQKGYGLGSGISLFSAANICEQFFWKAFAPVTINSGKGDEFEGAIVSAVHLLFTKRDKKRALLHSFYRAELPNLFQVVSTLIVFFVVVYLQGFRYEIPIKSTKIRGPYRSYPIKLFYTSNTPIMLQSALTSNTFIVSQMLYNKFPNNLLVKILGTWDARPGSNQLFASGGISYYMQPPFSVQEAMMDPIKTVVYISIVLGFCATFSKTWTEILGLLAKDVARQFKEQGLVIVGKRETSVYKELKNIIPTAAAFGGATIGALSVVSDLLGTLGSGTSILLVVTTFYGYYEIAIREGGLSMKLPKGFGEN